MKILIIVFAVALVVVGIIVLFKILKKLFTNYNEPLTGKEKTGLLLAIGAIITGLIIFFKQSKR
jgi:LPXTG-motif cell wall-anchored protein